MIDVKKYIQSCLLGNGSQPPLSETQSDGSHNKMRSRKSMHFTTRGSQQGSFSTVMTTLQVLRYTVDVGPVID